MSKVEEPTAIRAADRQGELPAKSMWRLPGLDKDAFYAAALYLHVAIGGKEVKPMIRTPNTPEQTRNFLDRLADSFARSKELDARDHVSATAMSRDDDLKTITIYIAKNQIYKMVNTASLIAKDKEINESENENETFAKGLVDWFTALANRDDELIVTQGIKQYWMEFETMCEFSRSRLEHYTEKIGELCVLGQIDNLDYLVAYLKEPARLGWAEAKKVIEACLAYPLHSKNFLTLRQWHDDASQSLVEGAITSKARPASKAELAAHAELAGKARKDQNFHELRNEVLAATGDKRARSRGLAKVLQGIEYLGRHHAAFVKFMEFCTDEKQKGFAFNYYLLPSQEEKFDGTAYLQKFDSWIGNFSIATEDGVRDVRPAMQDIVQKGHTARVHCEISLLMHSVEQNIRFLDYIGGSKKSCWLCWRMLKEANMFSVKGSHYKLFPHWAFPFDFSPTKAGPASGLRAAYEDMISTLQAKAVLGQSLLSVGQHLQSSARFTPSHLLNQAPSTSNLDIGLFPGTIIAAKDKLPVVQIPALHFPAAPSSPEVVRRVKVSMYAREKNRGEPLFSDFHFGGRFVLPAFALIAFEHVENWAEGIDTAMQVLWSSSYIVNSKGAYQLYARSAVSLTPNPYLERIWSLVAPTEMRTEHFPWRGDAFIFEVNSAYYPDRQIDNVKETGNFDPDEKTCLAAIEYFLARETVDDLENEMHSAREHAELMLLAGKDNIDVVEFL